MIQWTINHLCFGHYLGIEQATSHYLIQWWPCHRMETFSALLAICAGNSPVPGEFPAQRPVTRSFDVFFDLHPNKRLSKQSRGWWFETPSCPLWCHRNADSCSYFYIPPPLQLSWKGGYTGFTLSVCPSVDRIVSALYLQQYSSDPFHICTSYLFFTYGRSVGRWSSIVLQQVVRHRFYNKMCGHHLQWRCGRVAPHQGRTSGLLQWERDGMGNVICLYNNTHN